MHQKNASLLRPSCSIPPSYFPPLSDNTHQPILWQHKQCHPRLMDPLRHTHSHISQTLTGSKHVASMWSGWTCRPQQDQTHFILGINTVSPVTRKFYEAISCAHGFIHALQTDLDSMITCRMPRWQADTSYSSASHFTSFIFPGQSCHLVFETWVHYLESGQSGTHPSSL